MKKFLIITGGSSGIGFATAKIFKDDSFEIINLSRTTINLDKAIHIDVDLSNSNWQKSLESNFKDLLSSADKICLIHNASKMQSDTVESFNDDDLREVIEVNLIGPSILNKITIPFMNKGSSILYVGSTLSEKAVPHMSSYVMTKHGMIGLMRSTCQDLFGRFIHTACICPGATETEMLVEYVQGNEEALKIMASTLSENRLITSEEIAKTLFFCANNSVVNGSVIHANLGIQET